MPNNFFSVDSRFPSLEGKPQSEINAEMRNYLFMLLEQLRYTLGNLGAANFNETELAGISETITSPIYARIGQTELAIDELGTQIKGKVTFADLAGNGTTVINGANIKTGTISAVDIEGCQITSQNLEGKLMIFANGSLTIYNGNNMIGGIYPDSSNNLVIHGYGTIMRNSVKFDMTPNVNGLDILHAGNILSYLTTNAASVRSALGLG